jgi:hypothetical protein
MRIRTELGGDWSWRPNEVAICDGCLVVFRQRKRPASFCTSCARLPLDRRPAPPLGLWPITRPGQKVTVRVPVVANPDSDRVAGFKRATIGLCAECGEVFTATRADVGGCDGCRMRRQRRQRAAA